MRGLLQKLLFRKGIESLDEMSKDEKVIFDNYEKIFSKEKSTIEDFERFLKYQIDIIENKWADFNIDENRKSQLRPYHTCFKLLLNMIYAPLKEKEALEQNINQQINAV